MNQLAYVKDTGMFRDPYTGIMAMILFMALDDLRALGGEDSVRRAGQQINRGEVLAFWQSTWALELVQRFGYDIDLLKAIVRRATT